MRKTLLAGLAGVALIGVAVMAQAKSPVVHQISVTVPGGGVATVRYTGDVAPKISVSNGPAAIDAFAPAPWVYGPDSAFAQLDQISTAMDRQAAAMMQRAKDLMAQSNPNEPFSAKFAPLPESSQSYSFVSTMSGNGTCMRSVQITYKGNKPHVVRLSSGNCSGSSATQVRPASNPTAFDRANTIQANAVSYTPSHKASPMPS